jgi:hypothetical protein
MRIDSQHPGYLQDDSRARDVADPVSRYDPALPEVRPEAEPLLVDGDFIEDLRLGGVGMAPFFGLDGVEAVPAFEYEVGLDGPAETAALFEPLGLEVDGFNARGAAFARALIVEPLGLELDHVAPHQRNPAPGPASFHPGDALEPRLSAVLRTGTPPQLGSDGVGFDPPGFDVRQPIVGADDVDYAATIRRPSAAPEFRHAGDGIEPARRDRLRFAA